MQEACQTIMPILPQLILICGSLSFHKSFHCYAKFPKKMQATTPIGMLLVFAELLVLRIYYFKGNSYLCIFFNTAV